MSYNPTSFLKIQCDSGFCHLPYLLAHDRIPINIFKEDLFYGKV